MKTLKEFLYILSKSDEVFAVAIVMLICQILIAFSGSISAIYHAVFWNSWGL